MRHKLRFFEMTTTFEALFQNRHGECLFGGLLWNRHGECLFGGVSWNFVSLASFLIVDLSFALIGQNFVRHRDRLEFFGTILVFVGASGE